MPLRNIPIEKASKLAELIECHPGQVSSMALTRNAGFDMTLLAFAAGESVSEEEYFGDVMYYAVQGSFVVVLPEQSIVVTEGQVLKVEARMVHALEGAAGGAFKVLQINTYE